MMKNAVICDYSTKIFLSLLRFVLKFPRDLTTITFNDLIRGPISFERDQLDDFIIVRSDGTPMYNFVVVVDDAWMAYYAYFTRRRSYLKYS